MPNSKQDPREVEAAQAPTQASASQQTAASTELDTLVDAFTSDDINKVHLAPAADSFEDSRAQMLAWIRARGLTKSALVQADELRHEASGGAKGTDAEMQLRNLEKIHLQQARTGAEGLVDEFLKQAEDATVQDITDHMLGTGRYKK